MIKLYKNIVFYWLEVSAKPQFFICVINQSTLFFLKTLVVWHCEMIDKNVIFHRNFFLNCTYISSEKNIVETVFEKHY